MTKNSGDIVDPWTNLTLLNYLDLDGDKGEIRAIKNFILNIIEILWSNLPEAHDFTDVAEGG